MADGTEDTGSGVVVTVLKAAANPSPTSLSAIFAQETGERPYEDPPVDPDKLLTAVERSGVLRPNIDAYITNIDSRGHHFTPALEIDAPTAARFVAELLLTEKLLRADDIGAPTMKVVAPTEAETTERLEELRRRVAVDKARAEAFFSQSSPDGGFTGLRRLTRQDLESLGNAYWEVLRDQNRRPRTLLRIPAKTVRIGKRTAEEVEIKEWRRDTPISVPQLVRAKKIFKRFVQLGANVSTKTWFKELGDPRAMSRATGKYYETEAERLAAEPDAAPATEILHFEIPSGLSVYGLPRWIGELPGVLGSRELDEVNLDFFVANAVPALAILVAGGRFGQGQQERLKEFFEEEVRGRRSVHKAIVLEAESARRPGAQGPSPNPKIEFVPLRDAQAQDGLFQVYDKRNIDKIAASFRHPPAVATGQKPTLEEMRFVEEQVYQPERDAFDEIMNRRLLPELNVAFVSFKTNATMVRDPEVVGKLAISAAQRGVLTPDESRKVLESIFDFKFPALDTSWSKQPIPLTLATLGVVAGPAEAVRQQGRQGGKTPNSLPLLSDLGAESGTAAPAPPAPTGPRKLSALKAIRATGSGADDDAEPV